MTVTQLLKKLPVDLGQAEMKEKTKGKLIAYSFVPHVANGAALDIGCRDGYWSKKLAEKGYSVDSIDVDPKCPFGIKMDVNDGLPFDHESYDIIWCSEVLEHLNEPEKVLRQMLPLLKPNGRIVATVPNSYFWLMRLFHLVGFSPRQLQNEGHKHFFNESSIKAILPDNSMIYGFFPYCLLKFGITRFIGILSPTFILIIPKNAIDFNHIN